MPKSEPFFCPVCVSDGTYSGKLKFDEDPTPTCGNHKTPVPMEPVSTRRKAWASRRVPG